ncbi:hypothetical protein AVHM3334_01005 [Acidovorax sp. SUPP3334]|nr:hypothetical protein AVHM3334_01005 [Acidovorax sp. SUPP3334]
MTAFHASPPVDPADRLDRLARKRAGAKTGWIIHAGVYLCVNLALAALAAYQGRHWAIFPAMGWGLGLAIRGAAVWLALPGGRLHARLLERERDATLGASRATLHPLADEFARLRDYLELMSVRMGPRLAYTLDLPESMARVPVPPLLLQPLAENAIRHGLEPKVEGGTLHIAARQLPDGRLELLVKDSGVGLADPGGAAPPPAMLAHHQSFGLSQVRERLHTLYGSQGTIELIAMCLSVTCARAVFPSKPLLLP